MTGSLTLRVISFLKEILREETKFSFPSGYQFDMAFGLGM